MRKRGRVWTFALAAVTDWLSLVKKAGEALRHTYGTGQHGTYFQVNVLFIGVFLFQVTGIGAFWKSRNCFELRPTTITEYINVPSNARLTVLHILQYDLRPCELCIHNLKYLGYQFFKTDETI